MAADAQAQTKASLKAWWRQFSFVQRAKKEGVDIDKVHHTVFGKPLNESLRYASVHISTADANGQLYIWGFIPVVVAKCGLYLKETATEIPGTFRVSGSTKRMRDLQAVFESPPRFGKDIEWQKETYTTHDVATVLRRYLTQMPEPVIPHELYHEFRDALSRKPYNPEEIISTYKRLIQRMPAANQYLLLYVLDLLSVFARKSDINLMTATNLAVIFRPGLISHPKHEMSPEQHQLSQQVLEFLIAQQDWFMLEIAPPSSGRIEEDLAPDGEEGWSIVDGSPTDGKVRLGRRRTTSGPRTPAVMSPPPSSSNEAAAPLPGVAPQDLSPVSEKSLAIGATAGVSRSRTLPSSRTKDTDAPRTKDAEAGGTVREHHHVLRKRPGNGRRVSSNPPTEEGKRKQAG